MWMYHFGGHHSATIYPDSRRIKNIFYDEGNLSMNSILDDIRKPYSVR